MSEFQLQMSWKSIIYLWQYFDKSRYWLKAAKLVGIFQYQRPNLSQMFQKLIV